MGKFEKYLEEGSSSMKRAEKAVTAGEMWVDEYMQFDQRLDSEVHDMLESARDIIEELSDIIADFS